MKRLMLASLGSALMASPAYADQAGDIRSADTRVAQSQKAYNAAVRSGDSATVANERANLAAARAVAWSRRNPARQPTARRPR